MALEGFTALPECSRKAQTTPDRARYWLKLLEVETIKSGNVRYVPSTAVDLLGNMARMVSSGMPPSEAAKKAKEETPGPVDTVQVSPSNQDTRLESIEKAVLLMASEIRGLRQENAVLRSDLQKALSYLPEPMPISPEEKPTLSNIAEVRFDPPMVSQVIESQRQISTWESIQITLNDMFCFVFGVDLGRKAV